MRLRGNDRPHPDERFDNHKAGMKSNRFVRLCGLRLLPELYGCYNPMPYEAAREMEVELAIGLREEWYEVWHAQGELLIQPVAARQGNSAELYCISQ